MLHTRSVRLFIGLSGFFVANALIANLVGVKIFALEDSLGLAPFEWSLFGQSGSLNFTVGVLLWPMVFILTDLMNEYFGRRGVRFVSWLTVALILYASVFVVIAIAAAPAGFWVGAAQDQGVPDLDRAFAAIFGQGVWAIAGSVVAFLIGQLIDVSIFHQIRRRTGDRMVWLRATGSTLVSQFVDSYVVLYIMFVLGPQQWPIELFLAVGTVNYLYKVCAAVALTPVIYLSRAGIERYLGQENAAELRQHAQLDR